jgi:hypothetical protein
MLGRLLILILLPGYMLAQPNNDVEALINSIIAQGDETNNLSYYDLLVYYYENPINLNRADRNDLHQLNLLTNDQIEKILQHRETAGTFKSVYELQSVDGLNIKDIKRVRPFIIVISGNNLKDSFKGIANGSHNYTTASYSRILEDMRGFTEAVYLGSPDKVQMRLRLRNPGKLSVGLAMQKDPGEPWLHNTKIKSPDYLTGHIYLENHGRLDQLALGDYRLQFGQGLVLGAGFMAGKNVETVGSIKQSSLGVLPYSSVTEANFFRGLATCVRLSNRIDLSVFYSNQHLDATVLPDDKNKVSSIRTGGLHRTASEIAAMDQLHEQVWGSAIIYRDSRFSIGGLVVSSQFNKFLQPSSQAYNYYRFSGTRLMNVSLFGEYRFNNFTWFGELAKSIGSGLGVNTGLLGQVSRYAGISLLVRYLEKDFHSLYGQSFTERSVLGNENGIYWGLKLNPLRAVTISAYYDIYHFPWLTSSTAAPAHGTDIMARLEYRFNRENMVFFQLRSEVAEVSVNGAMTDQVGDNRILKSIINFDYASSSALNFRSRIQYNRFNRSENGLLILQDINYNTLKFGLSGRFMIFDTESFISRQYVYEKDMLYTFNSRAFFGRGFNYYILVKYKPIRSLSLRAKLSFTEYADVGEIGSGYNLIQGNTRTQVTAQLHYKF